MKALWYGIRRGLRRLRILWNDVNGLLTIADVLGLVGFWLYRGTFRRTMAVGITLGGLLLLGQQVETGISARAAMTGTGLILIISCLGGLTLMFVSGSFSKHFLMLAEAKGSNLLEDMKRARSDIHAAALWSHVFHYEQALASETDRHAEQQAIRAHRDGIERKLFNLMRFDKAKADDDMGRLFACFGLSEDGWRYVFDYAIGVPVGRSLLHNRIRYDLAFVKDFYDGAPFHHTDTKLREQFDAAAPLLEARKRARMGWLFTFTLWVRRPMQAMWFHFICRAIQIRVATACRQLDRAYPGFIFCPDHFLWPTHESYEIVRQRLGEQAVEDLNAARRRIFYRVFHPEAELAHQLMHKAIYPDFDFATTLRRRFDPGYALGELDESWSQDLRLYNRALTSRRRQEAGRKAFIQQSRQAQRWLKRYLEADPSLAAGLDAEARRAVRIAVHIDHERICRRLERATVERMRDATLRARIIAIAADKAHWSLLLQKVRVHHTLARLQIEDYEFFLERILAGPHVSALPPAFARGARGPASPSDNAPRR